MHSDGDALHVNERNQLMRLAIFGAQGYALGAYMAIKEMYPARKVECFLVSKMGINAPVLPGLPVRELDDYVLGMTGADKDGVDVLIATPEMVHSEIEEILENYGFHNHICPTSERWAVMMDEYHARLGSFTPLKALPVGSVKPLVSVLAAKSHVDKALKRKYVFPEYMEPIQVGRDLCDKTVADITDNTGDNISKKNCNYCELTALYWIWKNRLCVGDSSDGNRFNDGEKAISIGMEEASREYQYYGLAQYRRMFELSEDDLLRLCSNDVDALLPYPLPYDPDIHEHHKRYIKEPDWMALNSALSELQPKYAKVFPDILKQRFLYNYNVIIAKKEVLEDYCRWLFPILARVEELSEPKGSERADRYIGYMGETLETLYFMHNADRLNVVHAGCKLCV